MNDEQLPQHFMETLSGHRAELDALDAQLVALLAKRFAVTTKVGELKAAYEASPLDAAREHAQLERLADLARENALSVNVTRTIFETLFALVRESHRNIARAKRAADGG